MKKIYVLMAAACVAASASAVEKEMADAPFKPVKGELVKNIASPVKASQVKADKVSKQLRAPQKASKAEQYAYFRPADNVMALGMSPNGSGYVGLGFGSSYGNLKFNNYSTGVKSSEWLYAEMDDYEIVNNSLEWNMKSANEFNFEQKSGVGQFMVPELYVTYESGEEDYYALETVEYLCGGGATYWLGDDDGQPFGVTFYQNAGMKNPEGYNGSSTYLNSYNIKDKEYSKTGVYNDPTATRNWITILEGQYEGQVVDNVAVDNFTIIQAAPESTYFLTMAWGWISVNASNATQLMSYIYPIDEDGIISDTPIALGYAAIKRGDTSFPVFYYNPLDEEGNELEGVVFIDSAVAITIEGFQGNKNIKEVTPVSGFYPFSWEAYSNGNYDVCKDNDLLMQFSFTVDGESVTRLLYNPGLYYYNQEQKNGEFVDDDTLSSLCYAQFFTDATFPWIHATEESVNVPLEGGEIAVSVNALYFDINGNIEDGLYTLSAPEWINVTFGESSRETGDTDMNIVVDPATEGRSGEIVLEGLGVSMNLAVIQGEGGAVSVVVADGAAEYYDLAGRRVAQPQKGIYIKKTGNKAEKVVL